MQDDEPQRLIKIKIKNMSLNLINGYTNKGLDTSRGSKRALGTSLRREPEMEEDPIQENNNDLVDIAKSQIHHQKLVIARLVSRLYQYLSSYCDILNNLNL